MKFDTKYRKFEMKDMTNNLLCIENKKTPTF